MQIIQYPHKILYTESTPVTSDDMKEVRKLGQQALKLLRTTDSGVGLAANQVGDNRRWFVSLFWKGAVINPEIVAFGDDFESQKEGCLSKPGYLRDVSRPSTIKVRWTSPKGTTINKSLKGLPARVFQHELDHLDGKNIWQLDIVNRAKTLLKRVLP